MIPYNDHPALRSGCLRTGAQTSLPDSHRGPADHVQGRRVDATRHSADVPTLALQDGHLAAYHATLCMYGRLLAPVAQVRGIGHEPLHTIGRPYNEEYTLNMVLMQPKYPLQNNATPVAPAEQAAFPLQTERWSPQAAKPWWSGKN